MKFCVPQHLPQYVLNKCCSLTFKGPWRLMTPLLMLVHQQHHPYTLLFKINRGMTSGAIQETGRELFWYNRSRVSLERRYRKGVEESVHVHETISWCDNKVQENGPHCKCILSLRLDKEDVQHLLCPRGGDMAPGISLSIYDGP